MRILHISSARIDYPGGTERVIWEFAKRQAKKNEVTILQTNLYQEKENFLKEEIREGVKVITCQNKLFLGGFGFSPEFIKRLKSIWQEFDIIHIHGHGRFASTYSLNFLHGRKPIIYSAQGFFHQKNIIKETYDLIFGHLLRNANFCTALTELEVDHLKKKFKVNSEKILLLPGGIDLNKFNRFSASGIKSFKKKFNLNGKTILYVGRIHESKGLQFVIDAISKIDCKLLIVGRDAGYKSRLKEKIQNKNMVEKVIFAEGLTDEQVILAYRSSDAFVLFSEWEGFGLVVIEAMAAELPVVASDRGALPYLVKNGINGYLSRNKQDLEMNIKLALKRNKKIIKNAKIFSKQFEWDNLSRTLYKTYEKAINTSKKR